MLSSQSSSDRFVATGYFTASSVRRSFTLRPNPAQQSSQPPWWPARACSFTTKNPQQRLTVRVRDLSHWQERARLQVCFFARLGKRPSSGGTQLIYVIQQDLRLQVGGGGVLDLSTGLIELRPKLKAELDETLLPSPWQVIRKSLGVSRL